MRRLSFAVLLGTVVLTVKAASGDPPASAPVRPPATAPAEMAAENWDSITAPVYGSSEAAPYAGAELFPGPAKFGPEKYFDGVLPNGRLVRPAGISAQVGMNPLGVAITPDGKYLLTSNDDERGGPLDENVLPPRPFASLRGGLNVGGYSLSVLDASTMRVVSQTDIAGRFFIGLQVAGTGPYTAYVSCGPDNDVKVITISAAGQVAQVPAGKIAIAPMTPADQGFVTHYTPGSALGMKEADGGKPGAPSKFDRKNGAEITFPAGSALGPDGKFLFVACNGDNSLAIIDTAAQRVVKQIKVGYLPYSVALNRDATRAYVSNWGITAYKFRYPKYDPATGALKAIGATGPNVPDGFYVPVTDVAGDKPQTSSISIVAIPDGNPAAASVVGAIYQGRPLDELRQVGDTHPSALACVGETLYVTRSNDDSLGLIPAGVLPEQRAKPKIVELPLIEVKKSNGEGLPLRGTCPNAIVRSTDASRTYVAEAGINSVAVLDTTAPASPRLLGRIPTGWYPTGVCLSPDDKTLYVINAKGIGEDINPNVPPGAANNATGVESFRDSNYIFGTAQKIDLSTLAFDHGLAAALNFAHHEQIATPLFPGGGKRSPRITHVFFILHENKTFDSMLGTEEHFGPFASSHFADEAGKAKYDAQYADVATNTRLLARTFATAVNYYSDSEESDAGHQFAASGTVTDYTEKTLLVKDGRGLLVNKNMDPEDYPAGGYIFNNAARNGVSFKDYGALVRIVGTDTGGAVPATRDDPLSGASGYPLRNAADGLENAGDVVSATRGLGQSYYLALPALAILGGKNADGEDRLDRNYPGYSFNISDQRRALEFCRDFDRMAKAGTLPRFVYIYQPVDHTGSVVASNVPPPTAPEQVADGDVALGMVVRHIMESPAYYDAAADKGSAIFVTYDDAQSTLDHVHPHRTPMFLVSPFARPGYIAKRHYCTASIVKTEELLLGLPPNNLGDLCATDLRDLFQEDYNGITAESLKFTRIVNYRSSDEGRRIWRLAEKLDTAAPDRDSLRLGKLARLSLAADRVKSEPGPGGGSDRSVQESFYRAAEALVRGPARRDDDD